MNIVAHIAFVSAKHFCMELLENRPRLKRTHAYYYQVHGQLRVCSLEFCDFLVYTEKGLLIVRIFFLADFLNDCEERTFIFLY